MIEKGMQPAVRYEVHTLLVSQTLQVWFLAVVFFFLRGFSMRVLEFFFLCPLTKHRFVFDGSMSSTQRNPEIVANVRFSRVLPTASLGDFEAKPDLQVFFFLLVLCFSPSSKGLWDDKSKRLYETAGRLVIFLPPFPPSLPNLLPSLSLPPLWLAQGRLGILTNHTMAKLKKIRDGRSETVRDSERQYSVRERESGGQVLAPKSNTVQVGI